jgi:hypothetical protein
MDRRTFIQAGAASGAVMSVLGISSCASSLQPQKRSVSERIAALDMDGIFQSMDARMAKLDGFRCIDGCEDSVANEVGTNAVKVLGQSIMFRELPLEAQLHPQMQRRMLDGVNSMEEAVFGRDTYLAYNEYLQDPRLSSAVKSSSDPALKFLERFDRQAGAVGASRRTRYRLRSIGTDVVHRMRRSSPQAVFEDALQKARQMERTAELAGSIEEANRRATIRRLGVPALEAWERDIYDISAHWQSTGGLLVASNAAAPDAAVQTAYSSSSSAAIMSPSEMSPVAEEPPLTLEEAYRLGRMQGRETAVRELNGQVESGRNMMEAGAWVMGIAATTALVGGILGLVDPMITAVMSATVGGILLVTGLIILAVGGAVKNRAQRRLTSIQ